MNTMNTEINMINANNFVVTQQSRDKLMSLLNDKEQKMFKDFVKIETFLAVVREKSFSKASRKLGISQPAVTQQIKLLEEYLNIQIVDRKKNGINLTKAGEELFQVFLRLEKQMLITEKEILKLVNKELLFVLGASPVIGNHVLPAFLNDIQKEISFKNSSHHC